MDKLLIFLLLNIFFGNAIFAQTEINKTIYFKSNSFELSPMAIKTLDSIYVLVQGKEFTLNLKGHTDNVGSEEFNLVLSENRVMAVNNYLTSKLIPASTIRIEKFGELSPIKGNDSEKNRAQNRRVEIKIIIQAEMEPIQVQQEVIEKEDWPPVNGILVNFDQLTYQIPGEKPGNTADIQVISTTSQMDPLNFTTVTTDDELLTSNLMFCLRPSGGTANCNLKFPTKIYIPVNRNAYCQPRNAFEFESQFDSITGRTIWKRVPTTFEIETWNKIEYLVFTVNNLCGPCKNVDCKMPKPHAEIKVKMKSNRYEMKKISAIYENANALFPGEFEKRNHYIIHLLDLNFKESPFLVASGKSKNEKYFRMSKLLVELKIDKKGYYVITRKMIRKSKPRKLTDEERKSALENGGSVAPTKE